MPNRFLEMEPKDDAALCDMLHGLFGIGDWMDGDSKPWYRARGIEIAKIKAMRRKRGLRIPELVLTARYCYRLQIPIRAPWELVKHIQDARKEQVATAVSDLSAQVQAAIEWEQTQSEQGTDWVGRLLRAQGSYRRDVLEEWKAAGRG